MKKNALLAAALLWPAVCGAAALESSSAAAERDFALAPLAALDAAAGNPEPFLQPALTPEPFSADAVPGAVLARVTLAAQLDRNLRATSVRFGARPRDLGVATDADFKRFFFAFSDAAGTALAPIGGFGQLRGAGVNARVDAATVYNFRLQINIFNPVRGSSLVMTPAAGTAGPSSSLNSGAALDAVRARAALMTLGGSEYWIFYGRDADGSGGFAKTRSFVFVHMNGLSSKAWPLAEAALTPDAPAVVNLGGAGISVTRTAAGELIVRALN